MVRLTWIGGLVMLMLRDQDDYIDKLTNILRSLRYEDEDVANESYRTKQALDELIELLKSLVTDL